MGLDASTPLSINPSTPLSINPSTPLSINPSTPLSINPSASLGVNSTRPVCCDRAVVVLGRLSSLYAELSNGRVK